VLTLVAVVLALTVIPSPWNWVAVLSAATVDVAETALLVRWSRRRRAAVGAEAMLGRTAVVVTALAPQGQVKLDGELWLATSETPVSPDEQVVVAEIDGLLLRVDPIT
jgi:membrane protein implicated in regulation of membrane protease activity